MIASMPEGHYPLRTMGADMDERDETRPEYRAPRLTVLGTIRDLTTMPPNVGQNKETHPNNKGSKLQ